MSQADLARAAKCSEGLIAQIETGRRQPGLANALNIAKAFGVPVGALGDVLVDAEELAEGVAVA